MGGVVDMNINARAALREFDGVVCDNGDRGIVCELSNDRLYAFVQWENSPRMRSAASMKHGINPLPLDESRALLFELAVAEALS